MACLSGCGPLARSHGLVRRELLQEGGHEVVRYIVVTLVLLIGAGLIFGVLGT
jgi:hypothetical protein